MDKTLILWGSFLICTGAIVYSGTRLSRYGDIIAEKSGLGRTWFGLIAMATVTSLPELVTGISSVVYAGLPDIAVGDVLGSCVFNMLILALLDAGHSRMPISAKAHHGHVLAAGFGILLIGVAGLGLFLGDDVAPIGWIGPYSIVFVVVYVVAMRLIFVYEKRQVAAYVRERAEELRYREVETREAVIRYGANALVVITAAVFLPGIGEGIARSTGLGQTFVGNIFIALSTSLPEVVVSLSAVRIGAIDLAIGNLFGSNIFNIAILAVDDILFFEGPLLSFVNPDHLLSAVTAMLMMSVAVIGLTYRAEKKRLFLAWDAIALIFLYVINILLLYALR